MAKISCLGLDKKTAIENQDTILDAFDKIDVELPNGCRSGSCGVCVVEILAGKEQLSNLSAIEHNTLQRLYPEALQRKTQLRLACRAQLATDNKNDNKKNNDKIIDDKIEIKIKTNLVNL